jgi:hypothetical protein
MADVRSPLRRAWRAIFALVTAVAVLAQPAHAQSILRDAETEALLDEM